MYLGGRWYRLDLTGNAGPGDAADALDVSVLQDRMLAPVLGIQDVRTDKRIDFVGGIRGTEELERLVDSGECRGGVFAVPGVDRRPDADRRRRRHHAAEVHLVRTEAARRPADPPHLTAVIPSRTI